MTVNNESSEPLSPHNVKIHLSKVETSDGTHTLYNKEFDQTYHSTSGAFEEAVEKYVKPCGVRNGFAILDYCFGLGYNTLAALEVAGNLSIVALENDETMLLSLMSIKFEKIERLHLFEDLIKPIIYAIRAGKKDFVFTVGTSKVRMLIGDAREKLPLYLRTSDRRFDAVFFDPFSPKVCPHLWTREVFGECYLALKSGGVLSTYSCARVVRDNMMTAGFVVTDGPVVGRRSASTNATKG
jgi:chorismate dehydratase